MHFRPAQNDVLGRNFLFASGSIYTKRFPFRISVILRVFGLRIFSYLMSLVSFAPIFTSIFFMHSSSTDNGTPLTKTRITVSFGFSIPAENGFDVNTSMWRLSKSKPSLHSASLLVFDPKCSVSTTPAQSKLSRTPRPCDVGIKTEPNRL